MRQILFLSLFLAVFTVQAQNNDLSVIRLVADNILNTHSYLIVDTKTGKTYSDSKNLPVDGDFTFQSKYLEWRYVNGVLNMAMLDLYKETNDKRYRDFVLGNYRFVFDNSPFIRKEYEKGLKNTGYYRFAAMKSLDDCGAMTAGLIGAYQYDKQPEYKVYIEKVGDYILHKEGRLTDGTLSRGADGHKTVWLDDLYMSVSFLSKMGSYSQNSKYFDFAAKQVILFSNLLYDSVTGLYFHCYYDYLKESCVAHWGRANGWSIYAQAYLLDVLPENHPLREQLLQVFRRQILGFSRYQSQSGLWHQLLDKNDSYLETSCSAMFAYAVAKGVNRGWIDKEFGSIALRAWEGICKQVSEKGEVSGICMGTGISHDLAFYYTRPAPLNDAHGLGAIIQAGLEVIKMKKNH
jgi:unsaturated rhamnogalacturonyl hydrolase